MTSEELNFDDFFDNEIEDIVDAEKLGELNKMVARRKELLDTIEQIDTSRKVLTDELLDIETRKIPDAMDNAGIAEFTTKDGYKIGVKPFVSAIPANFKETAFDWFDNNGMSSIIKRTVSLKFDKKQMAMAQMAEEKLREMGFEPDTKLDIPYQTFQASVKEMHEKGLMPPLHEWGVYFGRKATVKKK